MTSGSIPPKTAVDAAVFEVERFEWAAPDRIELAGVWTGVRGRRFIRPTLVLEGDGGRRRLLALLDHKPWSADDGDDWIAAFAWDGDPIAAEKAELNVGSGIDVELPPPRRASGKKPARRFKHRAVARNASGDEEDPQPEHAADAPGDDAGDRPRADTAELRRLRTELDVALDRATAAELRAGEVEKERDKAVARRKSLAGELEAAKQAQEEAVRAGRAEEREAATAMLAEGAEMRAGLERQRELAYAARDEALHDRDEAVRAMEQAIADRKQAIADRKAAFRERDKAFADRDWALREREQALIARENALQERDEARAEREDALNERDTIVSVHERGLPVVPPHPRHLPAERGRSALEVWLPRAFAGGALLLALVVVLRLFAGL